MMHNEIFIHIHHRHLYCRQGTAHRRMLMLGSRSLAMDYSTSMLVSRIEISPSIFMLWSRMTSSISQSTSMPCRDSRVVLCTRRNITSRSLRQDWFSNSFSGIPLYCDTRQIHLAHSIGSPLMISARKFWKFFFFSLVSRMAMPTSMRMISTRSLNWSITSCTSFSYSQFSSLSRRSSYESNPYLITWLISQFLLRLKKSSSCVLTEFGSYRIFTRMFPAWQSACTKLCFISIEKNAFAPMFAITLFMLCTCVQQKPMVSPSMNYSISTQFVDCSQVTGKRMLRSTTSLLKLSMLRFSFRKHSCSLRIFFSESSVMGMSKILDSFANIRLNINSRSMSRSRFWPTFGWRTFTATALPLSLALQTWLTEPDAMGVVLNSSNISPMSLPQIRLIIFSVSSSSCCGECSRRTENFPAISQPMMSRRWLRYWKALIQTIPARVTAFRKMLSHQSRVLRKRYNGRHMMVGVKMMPSYMKRRMYLAVETTRPSSVGPKNVSLYDTSSQTGLENYW